MNIDMGAVLKSLHETSDRLQQQAKDAKSIHVISSCTTTSIVLLALREALSEGLAAQKRINEAYDDYHGN